MDGEGSLAHGWWRWPLVPFAAFIGATLGAMLFMLLQWLAMKFNGSMSEDGWFFQFVLPAMQSAVFGWLYVLISCTVAPRARYVTGVVMTTTLICLLVLVTGYAWAKSYGSMTGSLIQLTINGVIASFSCVISLMNMKEEYGFK